MGTHVNGPSSVEVPTTGDDDDDEDHQDQYLLDTIRADPAYWLGKEDAHRGDLPYLFKVLSVRQALSIQAHPNKRLAEQLHAQMPHHYADDNHKPEIAIPLGSFEALCGFRPVDDIRRHVREVPELHTLIGGNPEEQDLRTLYSKLMRSEQTVVGEQVRALTARLAAKQEAERTPEEELVLRVAKDYPGDVGLFSIFFLNYVRIGGEGEGWLNAPHQFIYCAPDEPHAYLSGECVECMAISDNVVRAGLTLKHKDVDTLLDMMTYRDDLLHTLVGQGERVAPGVVKYDPPVPDFMVYEVDGPVPEGLALPHASIVTVINGSFDIDFRHSGDDGLFSDAAGPQQVSMGHTYFCRAGTELAVLAISEQARLFVATY
jgi:mannose-6-phosphate isomerase